MSTLIDQARTRVPRLAEAAVERARLTVVARPVQKAPRTPFVTLVSVLLLGGLVGLLLFNTHMQQGSFAATALSQRAAALAAEEQTLQMELDRLRDPQRVAARARRLGMVPAGSPAFISISDGEVLGNPTVAQPDDAVRIVPLPARKPADLAPEPVVVEPPATPARERREARQAAREERRQAREARREAGPGASSTDEARAGGTKKQRREARRQEREQRQGSER